MAWFIVGLFYFLPFQLEEQTIPNESLPANDVSDIEMRDQVSGARFEVVRLETQQLEIYYLSEEETEKLFATPSTESADPSLKFAEFAKTRAPAQLTSEVLVDKRRLQTLVDEFIVEKLLMMDGIANDDSIQIDWPLRQILIFTSNEEEMEATLKLLETLIGLASHSQIDLTSLNDTFGPFPFRIEATVDSEANEIHRIFMPTQNLAVGSLTTLLTPAEVQTRVSRILEELSHQSNNESFNSYSLNPRFWSIFPFVKTDPQTGERFTVVEYIVTWEFLEQLQNSLQTNYDSIRVHYYPTEVLRRVEAFTQQHAEEMKKHEWWIEMSEDRTRIFYQLGSSLERQLRKMVESIDTPPFLLLVEVSLLSVSRDLEREIGIAFSKGLASEEGSDAVLNLITKLVGKSGMGQVGMALAAGSSLLDVTIDAIESSGNGSRQVFPSQTTIELTGDEAKPIIFENKNVTPIVRATSNAISQESLEVGLGLTINKIRVLENRFFTEEKKELERRYRESFSENEALHEAIVSLYEKGDVSGWKQYINFAKSSKEDALSDLSDDPIGFSFDNSFYWIDPNNPFQLKAIQNYIQLVENHRRLMNELNSHLQIEIHAQLEDGSITRIVENETAISAFFQKVNYEFSMIIPNGQARFLGGSSATQERRDQEKIFGIIPVRSSRSGGEQALVAFLTVSVLDERTDRRITQQMSNLVGLHVLRKDLLPNLPGLQLPIVPTATDIRSEVFWVQREADKVSEVFGNYSNAGKKALSRIFWREVFEDITTHGQLKPNEWSSFSRVKEEIDRLRPLPLEDQEDDQVAVIALKTHPAVLRLLRTQKKISELQPIPLDPQQILAAVRAQGWIGGSPELEPNGQSDERILWYLSYLVAKEDHRVNATSRLNDPSSFSWIPADIADFERILPHLHQKNWRRELGSFEKRMKKRHGH